MLKLSIFMILSCAALCALLIGYDYVRDRLGLNKPTPPPPIVIPPIDYVPFLENVLIPCVRDIYAECALAIPKNTALHIVPPPDCTMAHPKYGTVYCYDFKRQPHLEGDLKNLCTRYSTMPLRDIARKINGVLPKYCITVGCRPCAIVNARDLENGVIRFVVGVAP